MPFDFRNISNKCQLLENQTRSRKSGTCRVPCCHPTCPTGMIRNKSNSLCLVKCVPGKTTRRRKSGRCQKINSPKRKSRSRKSSVRKSLSRKSKC